MRLGLVGDTHYTGKTPSRRLDSFWETQKRKTSQALKIFTDRKCDYVIQAGDMFDNPMVSYSVISDLICIFNEYVNTSHRKPGVTFGQHDIFGHSSATIPNSPLRVLEVAGVIDIVGPGGLTIGQNGDQNVVLYGAGFGEDVPEPKSKFDYNVLVTHRMVGDRPLFPDQELESPVSFLKQYPQYNLTLVGDYHYRFVSRLDNRVIVNCGALVRKSISTFDLEHEPAVVVFDTENSKLEVVKLDIESVDKVFDMTPVQKRDETRLTEFINNLRNRSNASDVGWRHRLLEVMNGMSSSDGVKAIINEALMEIRG